MRQLIGFLVALGAVTLVHAQTMSFSFPTSGSSNTDSFPVRYTIVNSAPPAVDRVWMTMTYVNGYFLPWKNLVYTIDLSVSAPTNGFTFAPLNGVTVPANVVNFVTCADGNPAFPMKDGSYTYVFRFNRTDGAVVSTSVGYTTISTATYPPLISSPANNSLWNRNMTITHDLAQAARIGGFPVYAIFTNALGVAVRKINYTSAREVNDTLTLDSIPRTLYTPDSLVRNADGDQLPPGVYNYTLYVADSQQHAANSTTVTNITVQWWTPAAIITFPAADGSTVYTSDTQIVIQYILPSLPYPGSLVLTIVNPHAYSSPPTNVYLDLPTSPSVEHTYTIPNSDSYLSDGNTTMYIQYRDTVGNAVNYSVFTAQVQRQTLPATILLPEPNVAFLADTSHPSSPVSIDISFELGEAPEENSVNVTFYQYFADLDIYVPWTILAATTDQTSVLLRNYSIQIYPEVVLPSNMSYLLGSTIRNGTYAIAVGYKDLLGNPYSTSAHVHNVTIMDYVMIVPPVVITVSGATVTNSDDNPSIRGVAFNAWIPILLLSGMAAGVLLTWYYFHEKLKAAEHDQGDPTEYRRVQVADS